MNIMEKFLKEKIYQGNVDFYKNNLFINTLENVCLIPLEEFFMFYYYRDKSCNEFISFMKEYLKSPYLIFYHNESEDNLGCHGFTCDNLKMLHSLMTENNFIDYYDLYVKWNNKSESNLEYKLIYPNYYCFNNFRNNTNKYFFMFIKTI